MAIDFGGAGKDEYPDGDIAQQEELDLGLSDDQKAQALLAKLRKDNAAKAQQLSAMDPPMRVDPFMFMVTRLNTFLDLALTPDTRVAFEVAFEHNMTPVLEQCLQQARQMQLTHAAKGKPNGLFLP